MFASWTAWFAPKVDQQARDLWVYHGGKRNIRPSCCDLFFSNDKNEPETRQLLQQKTVVIYHPSWIKDCHNRGRPVHLGPFVLPDFDFPIRRRIQSTASLPSSPHSPILTSTHSSPTPAPTYARTQTNSTRYSLPINVTFERSSSLGYVDDLDPQYGIPRRRARKVRSSDSPFIDFTSINGSNSASVIENEGATDELDANANESKLPDYFYRQDGWNNRPPPPPTPPRPASRASRSPLRKKRRLDTPEVFRRYECESDQMNEVESVDVIGNSIRNAMDNEQETISHNVENHVEEVINEGREDDVTEDQRNDRSERGTTPPQPESFHPAPYPNTPTPSRFHTPPTPTPQPSTISANQLKQRATVLLMALNPSRTSIFEAAEILRPGFGGFEIEEYGG
ncbi:7941_t:CDS:2 [Paraglomus brasilianum]|uniref:7941_t:CDS:1 n=1 Tax=Paraglomus brasilianum TaxID=144538 RepID=A0A9N9AHL8_9GLOM|nr:7941_t:CDS:2 [Paraglomus brasilianum]